MNQKSINGLYAITPEEPSAELLLEKVRQAIAGGARTLQYRNKSADQVTRLWQAEALAAFAKSKDVVFIVNDSVELARVTDADGIHLGKEDSDVASAREALGDKLIGVSCYNDLDRAIEAEKAGADYVAFGAAFPSATKPNAVHAPLDLYRQAMRKLSIPVVAIGGITPNNAKALIDAGVDAVAVISDLFEANDIRARAELFSRLFHKTTQ
ncbi:MAG TPA: thiamine phosphate synthase [Burkholderiales bacterium]|nr:thiamine phosphate synthase [Burkholderiales bacterium]